MSGWVIGLGVFVGTKLLFRNAQREREITKEINRLEKEAYKLTDEYRQKEKEKAELMGKYLEKQKPKLIAHVEKQVNRIKKQIDSIERKIKIKGETQRLKNKKLEKYKLLHKAQWDLRVLKETA